MAQVLHLSCRRCGERLKNPLDAYCPPCNLYLCYRAMPILLGLVLTGDLAPDFGGVSGRDEEGPLGYDDEEALIME